MKNLIVILKLIFRIIDRETKIEIFKKYLESNSNSLSSEFIMDAYEAELLKLVGIHEIDKNKREKLILLKKKMEGQFTVYQIQRASINYAFYKNGIEVKFKWNRIIRGLFWITSTIIFCISFASMMLFIQINEQFYLINFIFLFVLYILTCCCAYQSSPEVIAFMIGKKHNFKRIKYC